MTREFDQIPLRVPVTDRDHVQGNLWAPITLVEYGDFECPHCGRAYEVVKAVQRQLGARLCFVYRHFPLIEVHSRAQPVAIAAEAAGFQGKFWAMHDVLYENQGALDDYALMSYAARIGLDGAQFERDRRSAQARDRVGEDTLGGAHSGVSGTPTFFVNDLRYDGPWEGDALQTTLEEIVGRR